MQSLPCAPLPWIVINMSHRTDRIQLLRETFSNKHIERFEAIVRDDPEHGCRESHLAVIRNAKEHGYPWVLILEDDCEPYPEFHTHFQDVLQYLWEHRNDWEIYNGGPNPFTVNRVGGDCRAGGSTILQIQNWISAQFIIVNSSAYDKILAYDPTIHPKKIDDYYAKFSTLSSTPMLTRQRDTYSDLAKMVTNNIPLFERSRNMMRLFAAASLSP